MSSAIAFEKGLLPFWASWGCSGTASCKSEPRDKPTQVEMRLQAQIESCVKSCLSFSVFKKKVYRTKITFFFPEKGSPIYLCHKSEPLKQYMRFRKLWGKFTTCANLAANRELTVMVLLIKTFLGTRKHIVSILLDGGHSKEQYLIRQSVQVEI